MNMSIASLLDGGGSGMHANLTPLGINYLDLFSDQLFRNYTVAGFRATETF
jgi:hypothetical protein